MIAPTPELAAALEVIQRALIEIRLLGWGGSRQGLDPAQCDRLASIADAVHNLPHLLLTWDTCDRALLDGMLADHDARWGGHLVATWAQTLRMHTAVPDGAWRIDYADGAGNGYAIVDDGNGTVAISYDPVTPATSSTGFYSGGPPRHAVVPRDDARLIELWSHLHLACLGWSVARSKGTGAFKLTTAMGERDHVMPRGTTLATIDGLLATFGA